jgi:GxxExxY protein
LSRDNREATAETQRRREQTPRTDAEEKMRFDEFHSRNVADVENDPFTASIIAVLIEIHRELGPGLLESMYENAICHEFDLRGIAYQRQVPVNVVYKGKVIGEQRVDLIVEGRLLLELKCCETLSAVHRAQVICYLRVTGLKLALLVNFNVAVLKDGIKRIILSS